MLLPIFNLRAIIEDVNQKTGRNYPLDSDFGFKFFDEDKLTEINNTLQYLNQSVKASFFSAEERTLIKKQNALANETKAYCQNQPIEKPKTMIVDEALTKYIQSKEIYLTWQTHQSLQLSNPENWEQWSRTAHAIEFARLKKYWENQQALACHSNAAILEASELLPLLMHYCKSAQKTLRRYQYRFSIPVAIYDAYNNYLNTLHKALLNYHQQLTYSMLARLNAYDEKKPHVIAHIVDQLQQSGAEITHRYLPLPPYQDPLTYQQFSAYQNYINKYGNKETREKLFERSWFKDSISFPCLKKNTKTKQLQLIPKDFEQEIPTKKRSPAWLFKGTNLRHDFFGDKSALLAHLQKSPRVDNFSFNVEKPTQWQSLLIEIRSQEQLAKDALQELSHKRYQKLSSVFQRQTKQFLSKWELTLKQHLNQQLENKLFLAEKWAQALTDLEKQPLQAAVYAWYPCQQLRNLLHEIEENGKTLQIAPALQLRLKAVQDRTSQILLLNRIFQGFQHLAENKPMTESEWSYLAGYMELLKKRDQEQHQAFLSVCLVQRIQIYENLRKSLKTFFDNKTIKIQDAGDTQSPLDKVLLLYLAVTEFGDDNDKQMLEEKMQKFFLRYLYYILKNQLTKPHQNQQLLLESAETILLTIGKHYRYADNTLAEHLQQIKAIQHCPSLLKCKCLSLAMPLAEKFMEKIWDKDTAALDENISVFILSNKELQYGQSHLQILMAIRDQAVRENKTLEELNPKPSEQVLVGMSHETAMVKPLIEASIQAHQTAKQIKSKHLPLKQKTKYLHRLNQELQKKLKEVTSINLTSVLRIHTSQRLLFTKPYIDPQLLPTDREDSTHKRLTHS